MKDIKDMTSDELTKRLAQMENAQEAYAQETDRIWEAWEDEEQKFQRMYYAMEDTLIQCKPEHQDIVLAIHGKQDLLGSLKKRHTQFRQDYEEEVQKKHREFDLLMEDIYDQRNRLENEMD
jgi:predicted  nucleic acid-binding Zn-ribbon protein